MDSIDITMDKDEDIEWITVRGTHIPIKKGENKEQAVKSFFEERNRNNKNFQKHEENQKKEVEETNKRIEWTGFKVDENNNAYTKKYEDGTETIVYKDYSDEAGDYHVAEITDKNGKKTKRLFMTKNPETVFKMLNDAKNKEQSSGEKSEPEENKIPEDAVYQNAKKRLDNLIKGDTNKEKAMKELVKIRKSIPKNNYAKREQAERDIAKKYKIDEQDVIKMRPFADVVYGEDSMEYKTIQGEGKMEKEKKVAIDEDKRKLIDEIGGILKGKVDEELWKTIIGKAEKLAYNGSEAGKGTDEGEEVEEKGKEVVEEGKDKKAAKDKCGKDEEKDEEAKKKEIVKEFAKKEKLAKEVEDELGTFDHSEMTELEVAKYACDKLELGAAEGQELATLKGYLKGVAKAPKATYGYKKVAQDSGITEDEEFEKFTKGE